jgi:putative heme-binding domain-containing protein
MYTKRIEMIGNRFEDNRASAAYGLLLKEILDPSAKINEKFQTETFVLSDGNTVSGLVLSETPQKIKLIENPLAKAEPREINKADVEVRKKSPTSIMPKGLLDKLTRDEILDLIAYLAARGEKTHAAFGPGGHEHHKH